MSLSGAIPLGYPAAVVRFLVTLAMVVSASYCADFTTYIGDSNQYQVAAIATDPAGNTYVTGSRFIQPPIGNSLDEVFVTKLDATGTLVFTTTFGGKSNDNGWAIAVDPGGNIWVGGTTSSEDFPLHNALQATLGSPGQSGFLVKLAPDGTVIYSSYFGGIMGYSSVSGVATDQAGNVYVTGSTESSDFPTTPGLPDGMVTTGGMYQVYGAFVTKLDTTGIHIVYSALFAGDQVDCSAGSFCLQMPRSTAGVGIAIDGAGNALVAGNTNVTDLPVTPGGIRGYGAFVAKINAAGNELVYLTYLGPGANVVADFGPTQTIFATAIAADAAGNAYLTGNTNDPGFPATKGAYQTGLSGAAGQSMTDAFAVKLNPAGMMLWATYLGGPGSDSANSIGLDSSGDVWLTGVDGSGFPLVPPVPSTLGGGNFLAELSADGSALLYSAQFPGVGESVAVDPSGVVHVASNTDLVSTITPGQPFASRISSVVNATFSEQQYSGHVAPGELISIFGFGLGPTTPVTATPQNGFFPTSLGGVQVLLNGTAVPLLYVSGSQINAEIPAPLNDMTSGVMRVINNSAKLPDFRVWVAASDFGIFLGAINQDGSLNSPSNPAKVGSIVSIWATGFGNAAGPVDGAVARVANNFCGSCQISIGDLNETVAYAGTAPGLIDGMMQINFLIPAQISQSIGLTFDFDRLGIFGWTISVSP